MTIIEAPARLNVRHFRERIQCRAKYGDQECKRPAKWRVVMACCGHNDFLCHQCLEAAQTAVPTQRYRRTLTVDPEYFGCESCAKLHPTWKSAVKEIIKL